MKKAQERKYIKELKVSEAYLIDRMKNSCTP